jgi:hypothetical protein
VTLLELLNGIDDLDDDATIFVDRSAGLNANSPAAAEVSDMSESSEGMSRLLEVYLAKEVLQVWTEWRGGRQPSPEQRCRAVIWYFEKDSYIPVEADS